MEIMGVAVLTVFMIMQSGHNYRTAGAAAGSGSKRITEQHTVGGKGIYTRCNSCSIAITTKGWAFIIGNKEDDVFFCPKRKARQDKTSKNYHPKFRIHRKLLFQKKGQT